MPIIAWLLGVPLTVVLLLMLLGVFWDPGVSHPHPRGNRPTCHGFAGFALGLAFWRRHVQAQKKRAQGPLNEEEAKKVWLA